MTKGNSLRIRIHENSQVNEARRLVAKVSQELGFTETESGTVSIIVTEMATNLCKHAIDGEIVFRALEMAEDVGIEILSIDKGPGIFDMARCLQDGFSTVGSLGNGLGAIVRGSSEFDIYSIPGKGTVVLSRVWKQKHQQHSLPLENSLPLEIGNICLPIESEEENGDGWAIDQSKRISRLMVCDGLGHGPQAAEATLIAVDIFHRNRTLTPASLIKVLNDGMQSTRGAALAVAEVDHVNQAVHYSGIGNIAGRIITGGSVINMISQNGIVGEMNAKAQEYSYPFLEESVMIMNSDGLTTKLSVEKHPDLLVHHPSIIAAVMFSEFSRDKDDAIVLVARRSK
jgi:anti-sigma regulatory factor (Ser/Thr protein kinase)